MKGIAICGICARHTRSNEASSRRSRWSGNGSSADTGVKRTAYFSKNSSHSRVNVARRVNIFESEAASNGNTFVLLPRKRAGIAFTLGGFELRLIAIAEPQPGLQFGGFTHRRRLDLFDYPSGPLQALARVCDRGLHFGDRLEAIRLQAQRGDFRHPGPFPGRRHPPG